jgi:hypothetical protein
MDDYLERLRAQGAISFTNVHDLGKFLGLKGASPSGEFDKSVFPLLLRFLVKAGTPRTWKTLRKYTRVNGKSLPESVKPPSESFWELGHYFENCGSYVLWQGLTVWRGEHCDNHEVKIYPDGKMVGSVNCFTLDRMPIEGKTVKGILEEVLGRIKETPYWDEIDGIPVKK